MSVDHPFPGTAELAQAPHSAMRPDNPLLSHRWRLNIGIVGIMLAALSAFTGVMAIVQVNRSLDAVAQRGAYVNPTSLGTAVIIIAVYFMLALAYAGVGIWNIVTRSTAASAPLIAALVLGGTALVLIVVSIASAIANQQSTHFVGLAGNTLLVVRTILALRMKKVPATP